ncbi:hypothetical protein HK098_000424 [Nowakowskiella sp. JEL0407]|nr:hypothetical protein HK098_000424 [Nowakowskiella sp. JEL0407]
MSKMAHYTAQNVLASDPIKIEATISTTDYHEAAPRVQVQIVDPPSLSSQHLMITSGNDGRLFLRDMRSIFNPMLLYRVRGFVTSCAWAANYGAVVFADGTNTVRYMVLGDQTGSSITEDDTMNYRTMAMLVFSANVWCLDVSSYLPFAAACGADGAVRIGNVKRCELGLRRGIPQFDLYKLSWNADSNEFKMSTCKETKANTKQYGVILEPDEIAIHKISWCPNRSCASFLASGGRSGLVKIESVFHG